jgi:hypothetical protein
MNVRSLAKKTFARVSGAATFAAWMLAPGMVNAQAIDLNTNLDKVQQASGLSQTDLPTLIGSYIRAFLGILGVFFVILIIYAGFLYLNSQGEAEKTKQAVGLIKNAVIGLVIIFAAYAISSFVITAITTASA